jgi:hypothetical protein
VGGGLLIAAALAVAAFRADQSLGRASPTGSAGTGSSACSPTPCADLQGYTLWVSNVRLEGRVVSLQILFRNASHSTHADPQDIQLVDSQQQRSGPIFDAAGCSHWSRTEFHNGAELGPLTVCFRPATLGPPLILRWSPDMGLFCCQTDVGLP